jgi:hypothetical protein
MAVITEDMEEIFAVKMPWAERQRLIEAAFPSTAQLSWEKAFKNDTALFGEVLRGILKYDQARKGKPGPRPVAKREDSEARLLQFMGEDYSIDPMPEALRNLKGDLSLRGLCAKTGLDYNVIFRLIHGKIAPDVMHMTQIAEAFGKHPSYFLEYRIAFVVAALVAKMEEWPESSIVSYRKLRGGEY